MPADDRNLDGSTLLSRARLRAEITAKAELVRLVRNRAVLSDPGLERDTALDFLDEHATRLDAATVLVELDR